MDTVIRDLRNGKEWLRVNPKNRLQLQYSTDEGTHWRLRFKGDTRVGAFGQLEHSQNELRMRNANGLFFSRDRGTSWSRRSA